MSKLNLVFGVRKKWVAMTLAALMVTSFMPHSSVNAIKTPENEKIINSAQNGKKQTKISESLWKIGTGITFLLAAGIGSYELYEHKDNFKTKDQLLEELPELFEQCYFAHFRKSSWARQGIFVENDIVSTSRALEQISKDANAEFIKNAKETFYYSDFDNYISRENFKLSFTNRIETIKKNSNRWAKGGDLYKLIVNAPRNRILLLVKALRKDLYALCCIKEGYVSTVDYFMNTFKLSIDGGIPPYYIGY